MEKIGLILVVMAVMASPCFGYVDPGSGHLLLQALLAGFFGGFFFIKRIFTFPSFFRRQREQKNDPS